MKERQYGDLYTTAAPKRNACALSRDVKGRVPLTYIEINHVAMFTRDTITALNSTEHQGTTRHFNICN